VAGCKLGHAACVVVVWCDAWNVTEGVVVVVVVLAVYWTNSRSRLSRLLVAGALAILMVVFM
jgi:hypothetical protein